MATKSDAPHYAGNTISLIKNKKAVKVFEVKKESEFAKMIKRGIKLAKEKKLVLNIASYNDFIGNVSLLKLMRDKEIDFSIFDYPRLNKSTIDILLQHFSYAKEKRSQKILVSYEKKREDQSPISGNPMIGVLAKEETGLHRTKKANFNENNISAAQRIFEIKAENPTISFRKIASILEKEGNQTSRGGKFYGKSVQRLYERYKNLYSNFNLIEDLQKKTKNPEKSIDNLFKGFQNGQDFSDFIQLFPAEGVNLSNLKVDILNNKGEEIIQLDPFNESDESLFIPIEDFVEILPGGYFLRVKDGKKKYFGLFYAGIEVKNSVELETQHID